MYPVISEQITIVMNGRKRVNKGLTGFIQASLSKIQGLFKDF